MLKHNAALNDILQMTIGIAVGIMIMSSFRPTVCAQEATHPSTFMGSWRVERIEHGGVALPHLASQLRLEFSDKTAKLYQQSLPTLTVSYDANYETSEITWIHRRALRMRTQKGVFEFRGDKAVICMAAVFRPQPERFETTHGGSDTLFFLSRFEAKPAEQTKSRPKRVPLGIFSLSAEGDKSPRSTVQMSVDTKGNITGVFVDLKTNKEQPIVGSVNSETNDVTWFVGEDKATRMTTTAEALAAGSGKVVVKVGESDESTQSLTRAFGNDSDSKSPLPSPKE